MSLVSVIVPIFGAENTLLRCLDSLKSQTFEDFEVLMIDDGSPDRCGEMIDDYARKDQRFKAFHKENGGVSSARQFGIDHAIGDYTIHVDPDDWVETTMLEDLLRKSIEDDADMMICDFFENTYKGQKYIVQRPSSLETQIVLKELFVNLHGSCCNKLIKRSCYRDFNIKFPTELSFCEDEYVCVSFLMNKIKVSYLNKAFYHYIRNDENTLSKKYDRLSYLQDKKIIDVYERLLMGNPMCSFIVNKKKESAVYRAFYLGYDLFTSREFPRLFKKDLCVFMDSDTLSLFDKLGVFLSCIGFYKSTRMIFQWLLLLKRKLYE